MGNAREPPPWTASRLQTPQRSWPAHDWSHDRPCTGSKSKGDKCKALARWRELSTGADAGCSSFVVSGPGPKPS